MDVKLILRSYQPALRYCISCFEELDRKRAISLKSPKLDGMPRAGGGAGLEEQVARIDDLERRAAKSRDRALAILDEVERMEERLDDFDEKSVIRLRYIRGLSWDEIAREMKFGQRSVYRIHGAAIKKLRKLEK